MDKAQRACERLEMGEDETFMYLDWLIEHRDKVTMIQALPDRYLDRHIIGTVAKVKEGLGTEE